MPPLTHQLLSEVQPEHWVFVPHCTVFSVVTVPSHGVPVGTPRWAAAMPPVSVRFSLPCHMLQLGLNNSSQLFATTVPSICI